MVARRVGWIMIRKLITCYTSRCRARNETDPHPDASVQWLRRTATDTPGPPPPPAAGLHALTHAPRRGAAPAAAMASHMRPLCFLRRGPVTVVVLRSDWTALGKSVVSYDDWTALGK